MEQAHISQGKKFSKKRFMKVDILKTRRSVTFLLNFLPGQHMKPHGHPNRELYLYIIEGTGTLIVDDEEIEVTVGDVFYLDPEEQIGFTNTSDEKVSIYATMTKMSD